MKIGRVRICLSEIIVVLLFVFLLRGSTNTLEIYLKFALAFMWMFFAFVENQHAFSRMINNKLVIATVLYLIIRTFISMFISDDLSAPINYSLSLFVFFVGIFIMFYYYNRERQLNKLINVLLLIYFWYAIKAIVFYIQNPEAARIFREYQNSVTIGEGYGIAFGAAFVSVFFFSLFLNDTSRNRIRRVQYLLIVVIGAVLCFLVQASIIIYALFLGVCVDYVLYKYRKSKTSALGLFLLLMVVFFLFVFLKTEFYEFLISLNLSFKNAVTDRLAVLAKYALYQTESDAITGRVDVYFESIRMFLQHPLIGGASVFSYNELYRIGNHSTILDVFGRFGVIVGTLNSYIYVKYVCNLYNAKWYAAKGTIVCLLFMAILDPITQSSATALIFILVGLYNVLMMQNGDSYEESSRIR